ncbi:hypothetical protein NKI94_02155 [Mesorhizobium australicum]|jgi:hypothetical protein|uniref:hypothetical protein n=1 Tax=Mesorhizobium australicum TaxID=536018 RepID=UPI0003CE9529|nr:hypothetical protein X741_29095 [Mesorhizobium sp. LNHC229A00]
MTQALHYIPGGVCHNAAHCQYFAGDGSIHIGIDRDKLDTSLYRRRLVEPEIVATMEAAQSTLSWIFLSRVVAHLLIPRLSAFRLTRGWRHFAIRS